MLKNIVWPLFLCRFKLSPFKKEGDMLEHHIWLSPTSRADELARETAQWISAKRRSHPGVEILTAWPARETKGW